MRLAKLDHQTHARDGQAGAPRTGPIVEAAMQHAAVVAALMARDGGFLFENGDRGAGQPLQQTIRGCQANDSSAHHHDALRSGPTHSRPIHFSS